MFTAVMEKPRIAERVRLQGSEVPYFVTTVDEERQTVNLMPVAGHGRGFDDVPFSEVVRAQKASAKPETH